MGTRCYSPKENNGDDHDHYTLLDSKFLHINDKREQDNKTTEKHQEEPKNNPKDLGQGMKA